MKRLVAGALVSMASCCAAQKGCYRSAVEAAAAAGVEDAKGYRVESVSYDVFSQTGWALVRSCAHPERPGLMLRVATGKTPAGAMVSASKDAAMRSPVVVFAGTRVRVVKVEEVLRMELAGVAQASGREGDWIEVRLMGVDEREQFVTGLVRRDGSVEMDGR